MLAERNELAVQIALAAYLHPEWTVSEIAQNLGWAPLFIINALEEGVAMELYTFDQETDKLTLTIEHPLGGKDTMYSLGTEMGRLTDEILYKVASAGKEEQDVSHEQLQWSWLKGLPPLHLEMAAEVLKHAQLIGSYTMNDPYDEDSVYTFYSLLSSIEHQWGSKQFKPRSKAAKKRQKKERGGK